MMKENALSIFLIFLRLGLTSFGGPAAHLGYFRAEFVSRRKWLSDEDFAGLLALCQFLPGPASSQAGFAIGLRRGGGAGALAAFAGFTLPSALLLFFAAGLFAGASSPLLFGALAGLKAVAAAIVLDAVTSMARTLCPDLKRASIAVLAGAAVLALPGTTGMMVAIVAGAAAGYFLNAGEPAAPAPHSRLTRRAGVMFF